MAPLGTSEPPQPTFLLFMYPPSSARALALVSAPLAAGMAPSPPRWYAFITHRKAKTMNIPDLQTFILVLFVILVAAWASIPADWTTSPTTDDDEEH